MENNDKFRNFGLGFVIFGIFILLTSVILAGDYEYADSEDNVIESTTTVEIIDFVFPVVFGALFLIGGFFILKEQEIGVYLIWVGCFLGPVNEGISPILLGLNPPVDTMLFTVVTNLILAYLATMPFRESKQLPINQLG